MPQQPQSDDLQLLFKAVGVTISSLLAGGALGATTAARQLEEINESIRSVADSGHANPHFRLEDFAPQVAGATVRHADVGPNAFPVFVDVDAPAQPGALYLSAAATQLNIPDGDHLLIIWVRGSVGARELAFYSGTTLTNVAAAVNSYSKLTGVQATASATGVRFQSVDVASNAFVSVRAVAGGTVQGTAVGFYEMRADDFRQVDPAVAHPFSWAWLRDNGSDIVGQVNFVPAAGDGSTLRIHRPTLNADIELHPDATGSFLAFWIIEE
jgi:hypothetical protein